MDLNTPNPVRKKVAGDPADKAYRAYALSIADAGHIATRSAKKATIMHLDPA